MADSNYNIDVQITANNKAWKELDKLKWQADWLDKQFQNLWKIIAAAYVTRKVVDFWKEITQLAGQTEEVSRSFEKMTDSVGTSSQAVLQTLRDASKWSVSEYNLMLSANRAMTLWVAKNTDEFKTLMEIARNKAKIMWLTTEQAFNDIVTGLGRASPMILDNLGITIKAAEANEIYAKKIGKTANELTDAEKKQALVNAVVTQGRDEIEKMGIATVSSAEQQQILNAKWMDMKATLGMALLPAISDSVWKLAEMVTKVTENEEAMKALDWVIRWVGETVLFLTEWLTNLVWWLDKALDALAEFIVKNQESQATYNPRNWSSTNNYGQSYLRPEYRAMWWPVSSGKPYIVGEQWPELFIPKQSGSIAPNNTIAPSISLNFWGVNVHKESDIDMIAEKVQNAVVGSIKNLQLWLA